MNPLLLLGHWGVGEVILIIAIVGLLFGDRKTWNWVKSTTQTLKKMIQARRRTHAGRHTDQMSAQ